MAHGDGVRRLGARLAPRADGSPGIVPAGVAKLRQAVVSAVAASSVDLLFPGDLDVTPAGWIGRRPAAGDTVWVAISGTAPVVLGSQGGGTVLPLLNRNDNASGSGTAGTGGATVLSLGVTIPAGLPTGTHVRVDGDVFVSTAAGIGSSIAMTGPAGFTAPPTRSINQSATYDGHLVGYDVDPPAGGRTYTLVVASLTASQVATWRAPSLRAELLPPN